MANRKKCVSGMELGSEAAFTTQADGVWNVDISAVRGRIDAYLGEAAQAGKYSLSGLCIALGITRSRLALWRGGYFAAEDMADSAVLRNEALAEAVEMGLLHIQQYWEESDKPGTLCVKQLEATGALGECAPPSAKPPFDLGRLKKFAQ